MQIYILAVQIDAKISDRAPLNLRQFALGDQTYDGHGENRP